MPYSAEQMFHVVDDVASYAAFLPWCESSVVESQQEESMTATLTITGAGMRQSFTTRNVRDFPVSIEMSLLEGPFSSLQGRWKFTQLGEDGCKILMNLEFDFDNRLMNKTLGKVFESAADRLVDAFCHRAEALYG